jgi:hypothetical protein
MLPPPAPPWPIDSVPVRVVQLPILEVISTHLDDFSEPFGVGIELRVPEKSADIFSDFVLFNSQMNETITAVAESPIVEVGITSKKVRSA